MFSLHFKTSRRYSYKNGYSLRGCIKQSPNCVKNDPCDVIKIREMRGEVGKKTPKKEIDNPSFFDVTWLILSHFVKIVNFCEKLSIIGDYYDIFIGILKALYWSLETIST